MRPVHGFALCTALAGVPALHAQVPVPPAKVPAARPVFPDVDACSVLTLGAASDAIGVPVQAHHLVEPAKGTCFWSDSPTGDANNRRVLVTIMTDPVYDRMKASPILKNEPATSNAEDAFFNIPKGGDPILFLRKHGVPFQIKILNGFKVKPPLSPSEIKTRELALGNAAAVP
jgi:hypothetical protein